MADNKWDRLPGPPPPMFLGEKERNFVKQVNQELQERVIPQQVVYYPLSAEHTNYHPLYGEAIEKTFLPPIRVYAMVEWGGIETDTPKHGMDKTATITVKFHNRRLQEDQNIYVTIGDFLAYGDYYYEIVKVAEPRLLFGQVEHHFEIVAECLRSREGLFDAT